MFSGTRSSEAEVSPIARRTVNCQHVDQMSIMLLFGVGCKRPSVPLCKPSSRIRAELVMRISTCWVFSSNYSPLKRRENKRRCLRFRSQPPTAMGTRFGITMKGYAPLLPTSVSGSEIHPLRSPGYPLGLFSDYSNHGTEFSVKIREREQNWLEILTSDASGKSSVIFMRF